MCYYLPAVISLYSRNFPETFPQVPETIPAKFSEVPDIILAKFPDTSRIPQFLGTRNINE